MSEYKICKKCIMDTTSDPNLILDDKGVCNYCHSYDIEYQKRIPLKSQDNHQLKALFDKIKEDGKGKEYDCIIGISGGVDSAYLAHLAHQYGLRVLAVHVDGGWNSETAVQNIEKICNKLNFDLYTIVIDWTTMKELQRAYILSGVANQDVPQDHCFIAGINSQIKKFGIKYILNGSNIATEGILSTAYQYTARDWINIKDIYKHFGRGKISLKKYPHCNTLDNLLRSVGISSIKAVFPLDYIDYSKKYAMEVLEREYGWKYYGGKHYESRFTKFFQEVFLPQRFGWDKRRDHLSSLVVGGEMTRNEALKEIEIAPSSETDLKDELEYVLKKLDISMEEWEQMLNSPIKDAREFKNQIKIKSHFQKIKRTCSHIIKRK